ncbi:hypothetical protein BJ875DRAFT_537185 [Amylocarpus encephaloides]|uniref:DUF7881 domain-containing protein n=1 Tax=Amylocarpus encephaloides TaxID=45428 RepID=A0A9P8C2V9_9HELO|nr:hypothetical protein BJ875DRAFT_537185 [Amylocarpus encephaloides]
MGPITNTSIGGLILTAGVTNANLYAMIEIFVIFNGEYVLLDGSDVTIEKDNSPLLPGNYYIDSPPNFLVDPIRIDNETPLTRMISQKTGTRVQAFRDAVRSRDRRCVITRQVAISANRGRWDGFEASHILPSAFEGLWNDYNYGRWITNPLNGEKIKGGKINSDNYKIVCFDCDGNGIAETHFDQRPPDDPQRPAEQLLRWHFRQAVLHDLPSGSDIMVSILEGPKAAKRMEFEMFSRLATQFDLTK